MRHELKMNETFNEHYTGTKWKVRYHVEMFRDSSVGRASGLPDLTR